MSNERNCDSFWKVLSRLLTLRFASLMIRSPWRRVRLALTLYLTETNRQMWKMRQIDDPGPLCRECGKVVHPTRAVLVTKIPEQHLETVGSVHLPGIYCSADHAIDACSRGFPMAGLTFDHQ